MSFRVLGLPAEVFVPFYGQSEESLAAHGIERLVASEPGLPCRVTLESAQVRERVLLLNFEHQPAPTPFRSRHAIFVREGARRTYDAVGSLPQSFVDSLLSVRAFDNSHRMVDADVAAGLAANQIAERMLAAPSVAYLHVHYARRGCYAARIERA